MSAVELATWIGRTGQLSVKDMSVTVRITDVRQVWNRTDVLIVPRVLAWGHARAHRG